MASKKKRTNKKANLAMFFMILSLVLVFTFVITFIFANKALSEINADLQADPDIQNVTKEQLGDLNTRYPLTFDSLSVLVLGLLWVVIVAIAFFTDTHPIFYALFFILIIFLLIAGGILSNVWDDIISEPDISSLATHYPKTSWIMDNYILVMAILFFSGLIAMFVKNRLIE